MKHLTDELGATSALTRRARARGVKAVALLLGGIVLLAAVGHFAGNALLNRFVRPKLEETYAAQYPGSTLRIGALSYHFWGDRLRLTAVTLTGRDGADARAGSVSMARVKWSGLLLGNRKPAELLGRARLEITDLSATVLAAEYRVRCARLEVSVPKAEIVAQALDLAPVADDESFFAAAPFRRVRYRFAATSCALRGVGFADLFNGHGYRATAIDVQGPALDSLVNREKPRRPVTKVSPLPHEALAAIAQPFRIDRVTIADGRIQYAARRSAGAEPGVLTFSALQLTATGIANPAAGGEAIDILAESRLMDAGPLTIQMRIPVAPPSLAFHYSGKLGAMDLTQLDEYMAGAGRVQIDSGRASRIAFDIHVVDGHARGTVQGEYRDLHVKIVDGDTGREEGLTNRLATILANELTVRDANTPEAPGSLKSGKVDYQRKPEEGFLPFAWLALRAGLLDLINPG